MSLNNILAASKYTKLASSMAYADVKEPKPSTTMEDLLSEFRKNQDGKDRIEQKLGTIETKVNTNTKNINDHLTKYKKEFNNLNTKCQSMKLVVDSHDAAISDMRERKEEAPQRESI